MYYFLKCGSLTELKFLFLSLQLHLPPGHHGPHMYTQRMNMDPRFAYAVHIPRHGDPNLNRLPHNFNMQVLCVTYACVV